MTESTPPPATGARVPWERVPQRVRDAVEAHLGSPVVTASSVHSGFSPGAAARLRTADGQQVFVKAAGPEPNPRTPKVHRREVRVLRALPDDAPVPRLLHTVDEGEGGWVALILELVDGVVPATPWRPAELQRILGALDELTTTLTPSPISASVVGEASASLVFASRFWTKLAEDPPPGLDPWSAAHLADLAELEDRAPEAVAGDTLLHQDIRADNLLLTPERVWVVDWPWAQVGAPWLDLVGLAPSAAMQGGPRPEQLLARTVVGREADPEGVSAAVAAVAGYFTYQALQPAPPGLPTLRAFQEAQGREARRWVGERMGW